MSALEYPYATVKGRRSPLIPIGLGFQGKWQRVEAYVDSGVFYSVFKADFAPALALHWQQGVGAEVPLGHELS